MDIIYWETPQKGGSKRYHLTGLKLNDCKEWIRKSKKVNPKLMIIVWFVVRSDGSIMISGDNRCTK